MQPPPCQKTQSIIDEECTICGREMNLPFSLPCTHKFCYTCIKAHVEGTSATCPICRAVVSHSLLRDGEVDIIDSTNVWWNYASRDNASWWKFEPTTSTFIEEAYQLYLKDNRFVVARIYVSTKNTSSISTSCSKSPKATSVPPLERSSVSRRLSLKSQSWSKVLPDGT